VAGDAAGDDARAGRFGAGFEAGALADDACLFRPAMTGAH